MPTGATLGTIHITRGMLLAGTGIGTGTGDGTGIMGRTGAGTIRSMILGGDTHTGPATILDTGQVTILGTGQDTIRAITRDMDLEQGLTITGIYTMAKGTVPLHTGKTEGAMLQPQTAMLQEGQIQEV